MELPRSIIATVLTAFAFVQLAACLSKPKGPWTRFKTEPEARAAIITTKHITSDRSLLQPGLTFLSPYGKREWGLQIFDQEGELVWFDDQWATKVRAQSFQVCDYLGERGTHLCWAQGAWDGHGSRNRVFDNHYQPVKKAEYRGVDGLSGLNQHEFNMLPGGKTLIQMVYRHKYMDLRPYAGNKVGHIVEGCFQEIHAKTKKELFRWCWLDHLPIWETYIFLDVPKNKVNLSSNVGGKGVWNNAWDFMHMNAIDKNEEGDYIVSARHMNQIVKIAGRKNNLGLKPGTPIWRLGGKHSDFEIDGDALFSRQHHCRFVSTSRNETVITLFNNAWEGINEATARHSSGLMLSLNNETMKASLKHLYPHPENLLSPAQGSVQVLPNGNVYVGWGGLSSYSEFMQNGTLLFHADYNQGPVGYRIRKYQWEAEPLQSPKLLAYCQSCVTGADAPLFAYVSWNGATRAKYYRFHISTTPRRVRPHRLADAGPWIPFGTYERTGFETQVELSSALLSQLTGKQGNGFVPYVAVEALDAQQRPLPNGAAYAETFVPARSIARGCTRDHCRRPKRFAYPRSLSIAAVCGGSVAPYVVVLLVICAGLECLEYFCQRVWEREMHRPYAYAQLRDACEDAPGAGAGAAGEKRE